MNTGKAQTLIVTTMAASGVLIFVRAAHDGVRPTVRSGLGVMVAGTGLAMLAQVAPEVAGPLALLWLTGEVFMYGGPAFAAIAGATAKPTAKTSPARKTTTATRYV